MKQLFIAAALVLAAAAVPAQAQVGVSVNIGEPNFYGRIELGNAPPPRVIYTRPMVIEHTRVVEEPVYLRVPSGHRKDWKHHCRDYDACGRPVYFVQNDWYQRDYAPRYREQHGHGDHDHGDHDHDEHGDHDNGHDNGHGHGHGHDKHGNN